MSSLGRGKEATLPSWMTSKNSLMGNIEASSSIIGSNSVATQPSPNLIQTYPQNFPSTTSNSLQIQPSPNLMQTYPQNFPSTTSNPLQIQPSTNILPPYPQNFPSITSNPLQIQPSPNLMQTYPQNFPSITSNPLQIQPSPNLMQTYPQNFPSTTSNPLQNHQYVPHTYNQQNWMQPQPSSSSSSHFLLPLPPMPAARTAAAITIPSPRNMLASATVGSNSKTAIDPNNDISAWSEHQMEDGRTYWFNRLLGISTFDKPFVLKTPEERSIPPCDWKEYLTSDGKKYYSNGKESAVWTMPIEFKIWKEKVDQAVATKKAATIIASSSVSSSSSSSSSSYEGATDDKLSKFHGSSKNHGASAVSAVTPQVRNQPQQNNETVETLVFSTKEEAKTAFASLLSDKNILHTMKINQVIEICQSDPRWSAFKTIGEKKQELAEYQNKKLKLEKENQRIKNKRSRDLFLHMLAERVEIDYRTRWRDASLILQMDARYKNIEDPIEREELFNDFIAELEKKERHDRLLKKDQASTKFIEFLECLVKDNKINYKSVWGDLKSEIPNDFRDILGENDLRRAFSDFVKTLEDAYRQQKKLKRVQTQDTLDKLLDKFRSLLESMVRDNYGINENTKFRDLRGKLENNELYVNICKLLEENKDLPLTGDTHDVFKSVLKYAIARQKDDTNIIWDYLTLFQLRVTTDTTFDEFKQLLKSAAAVGSEEEEEGEDVLPTSLSKYDPRDKKLVVMHLRALINERSNGLVQAFKSVQDDAIKAKEEENRKLKKKFDSYLDVLSECYYRSDHVGTTFDEAKDTLSKYREFEDLTKEQRKSLFDNYMDELERRYKEKKKSMSELAKKTDDSSDSDDSVDKKSKKRKKHKEKKDKQEKKSRR